MVTVDRMSEIISVINTGIKEAIKTSLANNAVLIADLNREQLWAGKKADGADLTPTYLADTYFKSEKSAKNYRRWKYRITPPSETARLKLPARDIDTPNLYITGVFHRSIIATVSTESVELKSTDSSLSSGIISKFGANVLGIGKEAQEYIVDNIVSKGIEQHYRNCGYR